MTDLERAGALNTADEAALEDILRGVFREQDSNPKPNSFERTFGNAQRQAADRIEKKNDHTRQRAVTWKLGYGLLAAAVIVVLLEPWSAFEESLEAPSANFTLLQNESEQPNDTEVETRQLVADLSRSSQWVAPSDGWLKTQGTGVGSEVGKLPDFSGLKFTMQETLQWPDIET
jgi:hypothetical protein